MDLHLFDLFLEVVDDLFVLVHVDLNLFNIPDLLILDTPGPVGIAQGVKRLVIEEMARRDAGNHNGLGVASQGVL